MYVYEVKTFNIVEYARAEEYLNNPDYIVSEKLFCNPIKDKITGEIREATREEICARGNLDILEDGEYFENGIIKTIPKPQGFRIEWEYPKWVEKATKDEQLEYYKQEILKSTRELLVYKESGFSNDELQIKINKLVEKHKVLSEEIATIEDKKY